MTTWSTDGLMQEEWLLHMILGVLLHNKCENEYAFITQNGNVLRNKYICG